MSLEIVTTIREARERCSKLRSAGTLGFVPTMGALHAGHGALIERARRECARVAVSIFVNPIQFDRKEDYDRYARNLAADTAFCIDRSVNLIFAPEVHEMYPVPPQTFVEVTGISDRLCGAFRPGHFRGVATVVAKLFHIVQPDIAYFGEKDAQQLAIIRKMVNDLNLPLEIAAIPTVREPDGLALSSRNEGLSAQERRIAPLLFQALQAARRELESGKSTADALSTGLALLRQDSQMRVEYFEIVNEEMQPLTRLDGPARILAAVWLGGTRLIDNVPVEPRAS
jgi:pantoate--beta-alanine ligase